jgi:hypothetical protein
MRTPVSDFAGAVREHLLRHRRHGHDFPVAWELTLERIRPADLPGWGSLDSIGRGQHESPLAFLYRHMRAAFMARDAALYCSEDCDRLLPCPAHA